MPSTAGREATPWVWLVGLTTLAIVLRAIGLNAGLWYDEIVTLDTSVRLPFQQIVTTFPTNNQHTLFSVLAHASIAVFGEHPWSLRLPAMLLGAATVPLLYLLARDVAGRTEALLASALLAVSYHHVWFSQNARGYTAMAFLTVLSSVLLLRGLRRGRTIHFVGYGIAAALNIYAHLTMGFLVLSHAIVCLLPARLCPDRTPRSRWQPLIGFGVAGALTLLLYAPLLAGLRRFFLEREPHPEVATGVWAALALLEGLRVGSAGMAAGLVGMALVLAGVWSYWKQSTLVIGLFVLPAVATLAGTIALHRPIFPRFLFFSAPFAVLIVVRGAIDAGRRLERAHTSSTPRTPRASLALVAGLALASLLALVPNYRYPKQDFDGALRFADEQRAAHEPMATVGATTVVYRQHYGRDVSSITSLADLQRIRTGGARVWVLHTLDENIEAEVPDVMRALRAECAVVKSFHGTVGDGDVTVCTAPPIRAGHTDGPSDRER